MPPRKNKADAGVLEITGDDLQLEGSEAIENTDISDDQPGDKPGDDNTGTLEANAGKREGDIEAEVTRIERAGDNAELRLGNLGQTITQTILDVFRHRRFAWHEISTHEQRDITTAIEYAVKATVREAVRIIRADGQETIRAKLEKYADKGGEITLNLKIAAADDQTVLALHRASAKEVLIIAADADVYLTEAKRGSPADEEEPGLGFEAGSDDEDEEDELDDSALADGAEDTDLEGDGSISERVNLQEGTVESLDRAGDVMADRPATPEEMEAERERIADID